MSCFSARPAAGRVILRRRSATPPRTQGYQFRYCEAFVLLEELADGTR